MEYSAEYAVPEGDLQRNLVRTVNILESIILVGHPLNVEGSYCPRGTLERRTLVGTATLGIVLDKP
jgi:hypothetical protein